MKKYWAIIKAELQKQFTYRYEIASYVPGNFFELFFAYLLWTIIYQNTDVVRGYTYHEMVSYIVIGWIFAFLTANYNFESIISKDIRFGTLTNYLVKPMSYIKFILASALGRVGVAFLLIILQAVLYIYFFADKMVFDLSLGKLFVLFLMMLLTFFLKVLISILIGFVAFWLTEVNGVQAFSGMIVNFFAGNYFPLNFLPHTFYKIAQTLPFMYTFYTPVQFFLGKTNTQEAVIGLGIEALWCLALFYLVKVVYRVGLKRYEGVGI